MTRGDNYHTPKQMHLTNFAFMELMGNITIFKKNLLIVLYV